VNNADVQFTAAVQEFPRRVGSDTGGHHQHDGGRFSACLRRPASNESSRCRLDQTINVIGNLAFATARAVPVIPIFACVAKIAMPIDVVSSIQRSPQSG
jgi:hypothetical protein